MSKDMKSALGQCPVKSQVMSVIPVRYAIDDMIQDPVFPGNPDKLTGKHPLSEEEHWKGPLRLKNTSYTLRQLRDGWLYVCDETDDTFHEYQVKGSDLIKMDWGSNEAASKTEERGSPGKTKPFLEYPAKNKLYIAYSFHRWSWRVCEHMRSDSSSRHKWMRGVNLKSFCNSLEASHAGYIDKLADRVADIYEGSAPDDATFSQTCTPLKKPENPPESETPYQLVADKPATAKGDVMKGMKDPTTAMFIALDDPLGDITDLTLSLSHLWAEKEAALGDDENIHKIRMAEIVREIGRVRVPAEKLDKHNREDPLRVLECEELLNQYLLISALAEEDKRRLESPTYEPEHDMPASGAAEAAAKMKARLASNYGLKVTPGMHKKWSRTHIYHKEINWDGLKACLTEHYQALAGLDNKITLRYDEVLRGIDGLEEDALSVGIDTQVTTDISYLLDLISQSVAILKGAVPDEKRHHKLDKTLSLNSPNNLFALATSAFSRECWLAIDEQIQGLHKQVLAADSPGDDIAVSSAVANWGALTGDSRIQDKDWFQSQVVPVQKTFAALAEAVQTTAANSWQALVDLLLPAYHNPESLVDGLRMVLVGGIVDKQAVLQTNPNYLKEAEAMKSLVKPILTGMSNLINPETGTVIKPGKYDKLFQQLEKTIQNKMPQLIQVKGEALNEAMRSAIAENMQKIRGNAAAAGGKLKTATDAVGGLGGLMVGLGIWNTFLVLMSLPEKLKGAETKADVVKALLEPFYSTLYTCQFAYAVSLDRVWTEVSAKKGLMKMSVSNALQRSKGIAVTEQVLVKRFSNLMLTTSFLGALASGLEIWDSVNKAFNKDSSLLESSGYFLKAFAAAGNTFIFGAQFIFQLTSRFLGKVAIGATLARVRS